jgi:hypothetical protein
MENYMEVPQKIKNRTSTGPSNPTTGYIAKGNGINILKRQLHLHVYHSSQDAESTEVSINKQMNKEYVIHMQN